MARLNWRICLVFAVYVLFLIAFVQAPVLAGDKTQLDSRSAGPCGAAVYSIDLEVRNVRSAKGVITVDIHDDNSDGFLNNDGLVGRIHTPAHAQTTRICIAVESQGTYALAVYHDRDDDRVFDKNWVGLPAEPYGISNDPPIRLGPPSHEAAAFSVSGANVSVTVTLRGG